MWSLAWDPETRYHLEEGLQALPVQQNKIESVKELRRALEAAQAKTAALWAATEGADRAPRVNDTGDDDEADSAYRANYDDEHAGTAADGRAGPNARQGANTAIFFWGGRNRQAPKFPKNEDGAAMWRLRFRSHLDGMSLGYTLDHAVTPVPVKVDQRDLFSRYGDQPVQQAQATLACLLDATTEASFEERVLSAMTVRDAWCQVLNWAGLPSEAETLLLERQLKTVRNYGDADPNFFFPGWLTCLRLIDVRKTEQQIVKILVRNFSDHYEIEKRSRFDSPFPRRQRRGAYCPRLRGHPQDVPARTTVGIRDDAQLTRACCWWRVPDHTWRVWRTEERRWEIKWTWT